MKRSVRLPSRVPGLLSVALVLVSLGCGGKDSIPSDESDGTTVDAVGDLAADVALPDAEGTEADGGDFDSSGLGDAAGEVLDPVLSGLEVQTFENAPLSALLKVTSTPPANVEVVVVEAGTDRSFMVREKTGPASQHEVPLLGLRPDRSYELSVRAVVDGTPVGLESTAALKTPTLPADAPPVAVTVTNPESMSPGFTLLNLGRWAFILDLSWGRMLALDEAGDIVWYLELPYLAQGVEHLANGNLLFVAGVDSVVEVDMLGRTVGKWVAPDLGLDTFHHSATRLPSGNTVALSTEIRLIDGYVLNDGSTASFNVVGDVVAEFSPDGKVLQTWKLLDLLDPHVIKPDFLLPFWDLIYPGQKGGTKDWSHGNSVRYVEADDSFLVTLATLSWVVKIGRTSGKVEWIAGDGGNLDLTGPGKWPVHAHAGKMLPNSRVLLADGGQNGAEHSPRPVIYAIEPSESPEANGTASEEWSFEQEPFVALGPGDADFLENGNILFTDGTHVEYPDLPPLSPSNLLWVRVQELTPKMPPELVFEATVKDVAEQKTRYMSTGSERFGSLYPPGFEVVPVNTEGRPPQ